MLLLCAFIVGSSSAWADPETVASFSRSGNTNTTTGGEFTITFSAKSGYYQDANGDCYMQIRNTSAYWTTTPTSISLAANIGGGSGNTDLTDAVYVALLDADGNEISSTKTSVTSHITTNTGDNYNISIPVANNVYGVKISHNKQTGFNVRYYSFSLSYEAAGGNPSLTTSDLALTGAPIKLNFDLYNNSSAQVINYTTSSTGDVTIANCEYATFDINKTAKTITVTPTSVTPSAQTITVNQAADESYDTGTATFTLTITDSTPKTYSWVLTDLADLTAEDVFVIVGDNDNTYALSNNNGTGNAPSAVEVTIQNNEITSDITDNIKWTISGDADNGYTFYPNGDTDKWLYCTNSNNGVRVGTNSDKTFKLVDGYLNHVVTERYVGIYNSQDWRCYTSTNTNISGQSFAVYKYVNDAAVKNPVITVENTFIGSTTATITCSTGDATIYYSFDSENWTEYITALTITETKTIYAKAVKNEDESEVVSKTTTKVLPTPTVTVNGDLTFDLAGETNVNAGTLTAAVTYNEAAVEGATVTWSTSNPDIATIDENTGAVTIKTRGTVTFTATYAANSDYAEATGTKEITVTDSKTPGSEANPYKISDITAEEEGVYVQGIISSITEVSTQYKNATYKISEDGTTTNEFTVFRGRYLDNADFTSEDQISIGDAVVIYGNITTYNANLQLAQGNYIVSHVEKPASDLAKTSDIVLDYLNNNTTVDVTDYITSSSTGDYTFTVGDGTIIENADEIISALAVGSTTVTVNQAATLSYKAGSVVINVTVQDTREAASTIPAINISTLTKGAAEGTIEVVNPVKADEGVTFSFSSSNEDVLLIDGTDYIIGEIGTTTVTVTATASNSALYKNVTETFEVTVQSAEILENEIDIAFDSYSTVWGTNLEGLVSGSTGFDGVITATSSNDKVLTVAVDAEGNVTVTPVAVGSATVTFSATATASFLAAEDVQQEFTVTAPEGTNEAPAASDFVKVTATEDITNGEYLIVYEEGNVAFDGGLETLDKSSNTIDVEINEGVIEANATTEAATFTIDATAGTIKSKSGNYIGQTSNANGMATSEEAVYTNTISIEDEDVNIVSSGGAYLRYNSTSGQTRFRYFKSSTYTSQKAVQLYKLTGSETVKLNVNGYATYCSVNPMDFTTTEGYTAWRVSNVSGDGTITFEKITEAIKGGQGVLLYNKDADGENTSNVTVNFADGSTEFNSDENKLVGTTAPLYVADNDLYYGLKGYEFKKVNAGTVPAGKALLPADAVNAAVKSFTFVFVDPTTGISETRKVSREEVEGIFNLAGQRVSGAQKGIFIVNGKKVVK